MSSQEVRKGMVNYEENKSFSGFFIFEMLLLCGFVTWLGVSKFSWNGIATFLIAFIVCFILYQTRVFHVFSLLLSLAWGVAGYILCSFLVQVTGGGQVLSIVIGVIGFVLGALMSLGARSMGKQYYDDIE